LNFDCASSSLPIIIRHPGSAVLKSKYLIGRLELHVLAVEERQEDLAAPEEALRCPPVASVLGDTSH
jgi:hypothetical protein